MRLQERGGVAALVSVMLSLLSTLLIGAGLELGRWRATRLEMLHVADLAATAGLGAIDPAASFSTQPRLDEGRAVELAQESASRNLQLMRHAWLRSAQVTVAVTAGPPPSVRVTLAAEPPGSVLRKPLSVTGSAVLEAAR